MILGIGTDLVAIARIQKTVDRFGDRFLGKVFSPEEVRHCAARADRVACLAKRFAAKEAFVKALGTGMREGIWFHDIQVVANALGQPGIVVSGEAERRLETWGTVRVHVSLSDEKKYAVAFVVLEIIGEKAG